MVLPVQASDFSDDAAVEASVETDAENTENAEEGTEVDLSGEESAEESVEKENPEDREFVVPAKLKELMGDYEKEQMRNDLAVQAAVELVRDSAKEA